MLFSTIGTSIDDKVIAWHDVCLSGLLGEHGIAKKAVTSGASLTPPLKKALPSYASQSEINRYFDSSAQEVSISATLTLIAAMEALVRFDAKSRSTRPSHNGDLGAKLKIFYGQASADWHVPLSQGGILDAWKFYAHQAGAQSLQNAIGTFNDLMKLRHWVAHGRYWTLKRPISHFTPSKVAMAIEKLRVELTAFASLMNWDTFPRP